VIDKTIKIGGKNVTVWVFTDSKGVALPINFRAWRRSVYPHARGAQ
jgi:hypothetical protein